MLLLFLLPSLAAAAPLLHTVAIGELFNITVSTRAVAPVLPDWLVLQKGQLYGIPTAEHLGPHTVKLRNPDKLVEIRVEEDLSNPCGSQETTWVEVIYSLDAGVEKRADAAKKMASTLGVGMDSIRVFDFDYSRKFRSVEEIAKAEDGAYVVIKPFCDSVEVEAMDLATDDMDKLLDDDDDTESEFDVTITKGRVLTRKERYPGEVEATTQPSTTTTLRSTRQIIDNPPVRLNSLSGFSCIAGVLCESVVPEMTFKDAEQGDTYKLDLSVTRLEGEENFLFYKDRKIQGVPMRAGEYQFRLDARDRKGQMATAPFSVVVRPASSHNHLVIFQMDLRKDQDMESNPELLADFIRQLTSVAKTKADSVAIREIEKASGKTIVSWSNNSLPYKTCSEAGIERMMATMLTKQRKLMNRMFEKAMTERFNLRKVEYSLLDNCLRDEGLSGTGSTPSTVEATQESSFPWVMLIAVLSVLIVLFVCIVCMCSKKKTKKGSKPSEYVGKGLPVVFPEEVVDEQELAHASTPMLTKEERPPLKVSQHENPIYRPPPPLASASPRIGSSAAGSLPPTQRMPPPYVPP